jgi:hypothetical protein
MPSKDFCRYRVICNTVWLRAIAPPGLLEHDLNRGDNVHCEKRRRLMVFPSEGRAPKDGERPSQIRICRTDRDRSGFMEGFCDPLQKVADNESKMAPDGKKFRAMRGKTFEPR